jgi:hypothetical protein
MQRASAMSMSCEDKVHRTIEHEIWLLAQPLDIGDLEGKGILIRNGDWYEVARAADLPEHVAVKIRDIVNKNGKLLVQLPHSAKASQAIAERMGIDWRGPKPA